MPVKYKGEIDMYFVKGIRPELSVDLYRIPNNKFFVQLQKLRLTDLEEYLLARLETELPANISFHTMKHTMEVYSLAELLGRAEGLSEEDLLLVRTAALMNDTGYLSDPVNPEERTIEYVKELLPRYKFTEKQIYQVVRLLQDQQAKGSKMNECQRILADALNNYLGRVDFQLQAEKQYKELMALNKVNSREEWIRDTREQIQGHIFYTNTAERLREVTREQQLDALNKML
jgi:adenylate cyclase